MKIKIFVIADNSIYLTEEIYGTASDEMSIYNQANAAEDLDVVGIEKANHYIARYDYPITEGYLKELFADYDMVLPIAGRVKEESIAVQYKKNTSDENNDIEILRDMLAAEDEYVAAFDNVCQGKLITPYDQFIAKREIFVDVWKWCDAVISELNKKILVSINRTAADEKFLRDILFRVWILNHKPGLKIKEEASIVKNPQVFKNFLDKTDLTYKYVHIIEQDLIKTRKFDNFMTSIIDDKECDDDFEGKIPVWICWWQGLDDIPEVVRMCINSIEKNLPKERTTVRFITLENVGRYVTFTGDIINKFNEEKISFTHLAEALRAELLYRYGGMWIDATYYISRPVPVEFFDQDFYTVAFERPLFGPDMSGARWSTSLWYAKPKNKLMQFITEEIWIYWEKEDKVIDYFIMDYETAIPYNEFPEIKEMIDKCPKCSPAVYDLQLMLNCRCTDTLLNELKTKSGFYKLNRRIEYKKENFFGQQTLFGYLCDELNSSPIKKLKQNKETPIRINSTEKTNGEVLEIIRQCNPLAILDRAGFFAENGNVSRHTISDMFWNEVIIDGVQADRCILPIHYEIYDNIIKSSEDIDENKYELIIE